MSVNRSIKAGIAACLVACTVFASTPASAQSPREIRQRDDCDPVSFNQVLGPGACVINGGTTIDEFNAELAARRSVGAWKFDPDHTDIDRGARVLIVNRGGETHTFTKVAAFGGGFVAPLNQASGNPVPAPECAQVLPDGSLAPQPAGPSNMFVPGQSSAPLTVALPAGTSHYQCCIHPWMRSNLTQR